MSEDKREREFHGLLAKGLTAQLLKDYTTAYEIFKELIAKYPNEASPYIYLARVMTDGGLWEVDDDILSLLNKAEDLVESGYSKYPKDKYNGMAELYFLRGVKYYVQREENWDFYDKANEEINKALKLDPSFEQAKKVKEKIRDEKAPSKSCSIATAVYGSPMTREVVILQSFRDEVLSKTQVGRLFIKGYYRFSPPLARLISRSEVFKGVIRKAFISPLVRVVKHFQMEK